jgi:uncharacterized protein YqjF (DUF2071 family)
LLFVHWEVPPEALRPLLPPALSIDLFEERAYVGVVPFTMHNVRFGPIPFPDFLETNLRTYVHAGGVPGVWFFSLDAESALAVWGARAYYRLPYHRARMTSVRSGPSWDYTSRRDGPSGATLDVRWTLAEDRPHHAREGTLEYFLTERYSLYGHARSGGVYRLRVHHPPWPLQRVTLEHLSTTLPTAVGLPVGDPVDVVLASPEGVAVETFAREPARTSGLPERGPRRTEGCEPG